MGGGSIEGVDTAMRPAVEGKQPPPAAIAAATEEACEGGGSRSGSIVVLVCVGVRSGGGGIVCGKVVLVAGIAESAGADVTLERFVRLGGGRVVRLPDCWLEVGLLRLGRDVAIAEDGGTRRF